jgi:hypothetical protein
VNSEVQIDSSGTGMKWFFFTWAFVNVVNVWAFLANAKDTLQALLALLSIIALLYQFFAMVSVKVQTYLKSKNKNKHR